MTKRSLTLLALAAATTWLVTPPATGGGLRSDRISQPPDSLAQYYPPKSRRRTYTLEMLELGRLLGTLSVDVARGSPHAGASLSAFQAQWQKVEAMVPEWKSYFPRLNFKVAQTPDKLRTLVSEAEKSCTDCHVVEMFKVQAVYHWPEFADVSATDDEGNQISFHTTMVELSNQMAAIPEDVQRKDWEQAQAHGKGLRREFARLEQSCDSCHDESREYFVDKTVKGRVLKINGLVRSRKGTVKQLKSLMDEIYDESCIPCHQLHMPAAFLQMQMAR